MISISEQTCQPTPVEHDEPFLQMVPAIKRYARIAFCDLRTDEREEAIAEVLCAAFCAFRRLAKQGKQQLAFATPLARYAVVHFWAGRRVAGKLSSRDVLSVAAQRRRGFHLESLETEFSKPTAWVEILVDNRRTPVPEQVAFRLDVLAWLQTQNRRDRDLVQFLALGNTTTDAARQFAISTARVSQLRGALLASWQEFQGDAVA